MNDWKNVKQKEIVELRTGKLNANVAVENGEYSFFTYSPENLKIDSYAFDCEARATPRLYRDARA